MNTVTVILSYYITKPHQMVSRQYAMIRESSKEFPSMRWIVVDDCSPIPWNPHMSSPNLTVARIDEDIPHNNPGARNLGANLCFSDWMVLLDLDNITDMHFLRTVVHEELNPEKLYRLKERGKWDPDHTAVAESANGFVCTKKAFDAVGGYDEDFAGHYGCEDHFFGHCWIRSGRKAVHGVASPFPPLDTIDNTPTGLVRDPSHNRKLLAEKKRTGAKPVNPLRFKWNLVEMEHE